MSKLNDNKNIKYVLPIVIAIWGFFFFQLFDACNPPDVPSYKNITHTVIKPKISKKEKFELIPITTDPFLGTVYIKPAINANKGSIKKKEAIQWPTIQFLGLVSDEKSANSVFIISINGQQQLLKKGDTAMDVTVVKGNNENVTLEFKKEKKVYPLS